jgi:diacylglycerol kinase
MNIKKLIRSFGYAFEGLKLALTLDQNVRFHTVVGVLVLIISLFLKIDRFEFIFIIFAIFFVIITEMMNTAVEEMTDLIVQEHRREAKIAKDVAAGAVLLAAIFAVIVGFVVFLPHL